MVICLPDFQSAKATEGGFMRRMLERVVVGTLLLVWHCWLPVPAAEKPAGPQAKYVFLMIGDGMGENSIRLFREQFQKTAFDRLGEPVPTGTNNQNGGTTDSAASVIAGTMNPPGHIQNE